MERDTSSPSGADSSRQAHTDGLIQVWVLPEAAGRLKRRRAAVYALIAYCAVFFVGAITITFVIAANRGLGLGIGDGRLGVVPEAHGKGFWGDAILFLAALAIDGVVLFGWHWIASRCDSPTFDDPVVMPEAKDLRIEANWYALPMPRLTRVLVFIAWTGLIGVSGLGAALMPVALIRWGW